MKSSSFIDVSCWIIQNADRNMLEQSGIINELTMNFWPATKIRQQRWNEAIAEFAPSIEFAKPNDECWGKLVTLCDEIVLSETLSRVWFAVIITKTGSEDIIDVAQCIIPDHVKARKQALGLWEHAPNIVSEFKQRTMAVQAIRDQANDLMLSQVSEEVVGRNLSLSFANFDNFFACRCEYEPAVLMKANRVLSKSYSDDIAMLSPFECLNSDINLQTIISICDTFDDKEIELPAIISEAAAH